MAQASVWWPKVSKEPPMDGTYTDTNRRPAPGASDGARRATIRDLLSDLVEASGDTWAAEMFSLAALVSDAVADGDRDALLAASDGLRHLEHVLDRVADPDRSVLVRLGECQAFTALVEAAADRMVPALWPPTSPPPGIRCGSFGRSTSGQESPAANCRRHWPSPSRR